MSELERIERIRRRVPSIRDSRLVLGIGDDCAILRPPGATDDWLVSTDLLVEAVHFLPDTHAPSDIGHKALARGLSDIAAMGGEAKFCLISLALPDCVEDEWLDMFYEGVNRLGSETGTLLIGGDMAGAAQIVCDVVVCGSVPRDSAMRRDQARPGDAVYVSGSLGGSALGLESRTGDSWDRHLRPQPHLELGIFLRKTLGVRAAMDLSDGLSIDLLRFATESGVEIAIDQPPPCFPGASREQSLHGGEDYELVFTLSSRITVPSEAASVPLTRIGEVREGEAGRVTFLGELLQPGGWDHFRK